MKVRLLPLAISAAIAMPGVALAEGPTVYGKLNVSYEMVDSDFGYDSYVDENDDIIPLDPSSADRYELLSNASRFGVKGDAAINDSLKAIYQIEWEVGADEGNTFTSRDRFVGLSGGFGTVQAGKFDSPLKKSQGKVDQFNDLAGDVKYLIVGEERVDNIVQYSTPGISGFQANLAFMPGEEYDLGQDDAKDGPADAFSASVTFATDMLYLALAQDLDVATEAYLGLDTDLELFDTDSVPFDTTRLTGVLNLNALQLGAMFQTAKISDEDVYGDIDQDGVLLSAAFKLNQLVLKGQYGMSTLSDNDFDVDNDAEQIAFGVDYLLSKQTTVFAYLNMLSYELDVANSQEQTKDNIGVGLIHSF